MTELVECTRCNKKMMDEEYDNHECIPRIKAHKTIKFTHFYISEKDGKKEINITCKDGTWLECIEIPEDKEHTKIPYQPRQQPSLNTNKEDTDNLPEPSYEIIISFL